ncbi:hypothetical protein HanPI659440_Chr11g0440491 [Helianthus annuus]|nr:hypothetical protein HanIR_Chr17g0861191 [Helianthus annuus]KAJ0736165.1 hypothetical protein HanPI659440_Chr11g0440491 [Helianthus annuus]
MCSLFQAEDLHSITLSELGVARLCDVHFRCEIFNLFTYKSVDLSYVVCLISLTVSGKTFNRIGNHLKVSIRVHLAE